MAAVSTDRATRRAFTLIEMLAVLAIMGLLMAMAFGAFQNWGEGAAMRSAVLSIKSGLGNTRQFAITHRQRTTFACGNDADERAYYYATAGAEGLIGSTNYLPEGILFGDEETNAVTFKLDGSCTFSGIEQYRTLSLVERGRGTNGLSADIKVYRVTGRVKVKM